MKSLVTSSVFSSSFALTLILAHEGALALLSVRSSHGTQLSSSSSRQLLSSVDDHESYNDRVALSRRESVFAMTTAAGAATAAVFGNARPANAANGELFRPNPLMNPVLEKIRIWEQAEADEVKYGGELERGDAGMKSKGVEGYFPRLLIPILEIDNNLGRIEKLLVTSNQKESWKESRDILSQSMFQTVEFKKIFNAYGDNIYYTNPDRANLYLAGGATPRPEQSVAYLLRNEILTKVQDLQAELDYLLKQQASSTGIDPDDTQDVILLANQARAAMTKYLDILPPEEVEQARTVLLRAASS